MFGHPKIQVGLHEVCHPSCCFTANIGRQARAPLWWLIIELQELHVSAYILRNITGSATNIELDLDFHTLDKS